MLGLGAATVLASIVHGTEPEPRLVLEWTAPPECPDAEDVRERLFVYLGDDAVPSSHRAVGIVAPDATGWSLQLDIDGEQRVLHSPRCETLADAAAVVLSLAMDPEREPEPAPVIPPVVGPAAVAPDPDTLPIVARVRRAHLALRTDVGVSFGLVPVTSDVALTLAVLWPRARLELGGQLTPPNRDPRIGVTSVRIFYGSAAARGCYVQALGRFELPLCGGLEIGAVRVEARPARDSDARHAGFAGLSGSAAFVWRFHRLFALWSGAQAILPFGRPRVTLPGLGSWRSGPAALRIAIGLELRIP